MNGLEKLNVMYATPLDEVDDFARKILKKDMDLKRVCPKQTQDEEVEKICMKDPVRQNIHRAILPGGGTIPLLKIMQTSICEHNCYYCGFRAGRDIRRVTFSPDEMAGTFLALQQAGIVSGLFLSSGIIRGGIHSQDRILATAEILRKRHHFQGYIHLKLMPGMQRAQLEQAVLLADRISINLESPNPMRLKKLAPGKQFLDELIKPFHWMNEIRKTYDPRHAWRRRWPSMTTQFVVGGVDESDLELLRTTTILVKHFCISRAYFSGFKPVRDTPLENVPRVNPWREYRLYQASYLLRDYGYDLEDLVFNSKQDLLLDHDPKKHWAEIHLRNHPVEVNRADRHELLRVPGIGPVSVRLLLRDRGSGLQITQPGQLRRYGIVPERAAPYLLFHGKPAAGQSRLF